MLELFQESAQPGQSVNHSKGLAHLYAHTDEPSSLREIFVAECDGVVVGLLKCFMSQYWYSDDKRAVHEIVFVVKEHRNTEAAALLFRAFELWGKQNGAIFCSASIFVPSEEARSSFHRLMKQLDYTSAGALYKKELV
jgi:GNAT superfamily N-acetyltransferase